MTTGISNCDAEPTTATALMGSRQSIRQSDQRALTIRASTKSDLDRVLRWLNREYDGGGFYHNRECISDAHDEGRMVVLRSGRATIAFAALGRSAIHIFEVRPDMRRKGYGSMLAKHCFERFKSEGCTHVTGECNPGSSRPFWEKTFDCEITEPEPRWDACYARIWPPEGSNLSQEILDSVMPVVRAVKKL